MYYKCLENLVKALGKRSICSQYHEQDKTYYLRHKGVQLFQASEVRLEAGIPWL